MSCHVCICCCSIGCCSWHCSLSIFHLLLLLLLSNVIQEVSSASSSCYNGGTFLWFSDAHYDAFYGTIQAEIHKNGAPCNYTGENDGDGDAAPLYSAYGCGSNLALLTSAIQESARLSSELLTMMNDNDTTDTSDNETDTACRVDFIIFTGDAIRHNVDTSIAPNDNAHGALVNSALTLFHNLLQEYYPGVPTVDLPALDFGNNDFLGNYELIVNSSEPCLSTRDNGENIIPPLATNEWLINVTASHRDLFINDMEAAVFACGGYLNRLVRPNLRIISLNTVVWSINHIPAFETETIQQDPFGQFEWLQIQLNHARIADDKIYLTGHVPPILQSYTGGLGKPLMSSIYVTKYMELILLYSDVIAGQLFGHVHSNELRAMPIDSGAPDYAPPMIIQGSIAPCYTTTPFFSIVYYDRDGLTKYPTDLVTYHVDLDHVVATNTTNTTSSSSIWNRMFTNLTSFLDMNALTNAETRLLAERMAMHNTITGSDSCNSGSSSSNSPRCISIFRQYFDYWYKGLPQTDCSTTLCHVQEACLVYNGFDEIKWQECVLNEFGQTSVPTLTSSSAPPPTTLNSSATAVLLLLRFLFIIVVVVFLK